MIRRQHAFLTALAVLGLLVSVFQAWVVHLPPGDAATIDWCRFTRQVDCYESLIRYGKSITVGPLPVFATLLALYFFMATLVGTSWFVRPARAEGLIGLAGITAFLATGLALFVLLHDYQVAKVTSASAIASAGLGLTLSILAVLRGFPAAGLRAGLPAAGALLAIAALFAFLVHEAGATRLDAYWFKIHQESEHAPRHILHAGPPRDLPRAGAARLGQPSAENEALVFLSDDDASRGLARALAAREREFADRFLVHLFATGEFGRDLLRAQRRGKLRQFLETGILPKKPSEKKPADGDAFDAAALLQWQIEKTPNLPTRPATMIAGRAHSTPTAESVLAALSGE